jgi:hypothetical protein
MRRLFTIVVHALAAVFGRWAPPPWLRWIGRHTTTSQDLGSQSYCGTLISRTLPFLKISPASPTLSLRK